MCNIKQYNEDLTSSIIDSDLSSIPADILEISIDQQIDGNNFEQIITVR